MAKKWQLYEKVHNKFNETLGKRIISHHHRGKRVEKVYNAAHHLSNGRVHFGELCIALVFMATTYLFGNGENLPNNTTLVYPLYQVSTLECRTQLFSAMDESCKIKLPIIHGADYATYQNDPAYTDIYTVLRGASYTYQWDQSTGAHYAVDIATAKGTPLYAIADGEVYAAEYNTAYGNVVKIKFKYKGEILYATYAHMNSYNVKAGDLVKKGQKIWEVGNSGNVSGELWGFHVHFEIDKDAGGRPAYAFTNCAEVKKGHYEIIQKGYCRVELFQYTKDPIVLLEGANATYPVSSSSDTSWGGNEHPTSPTVPTVPTVPAVPSQPSLPSSPSTDTSSPSTDTPTPPSTTSPTPSQGGKIPLDTSKADLVGKEFLNKWDITIEKNFGETVAVGDELLFTATIKNKITGEAFHGTLTQPLLLIASNTNVNINPVSTVLITRGKATMKVAPSIKGNVYIAINLGTAKLGGVVVNIK